MLPTFSKLKPSIQEAFETVTQISEPCIRLARGKFELTIKDLAGGKNSTLLTSS